MPGVVEVSFLGTEPLIGRYLPGVSGAPRRSHIQVPNVHTVPEHRTPIIHTGKGKGKGKGHPCTGTEVLYRPHGLQGE